MQKGSFFSTFALALIFCWFFFLGGSYLVYLFSLEANYFTVGFPCGSAGKESACNMEDLGLVPGLGRSPRDRKSYPLQCSGLENSMDCTVHGVAESDTTEWLSLFYNVVVIFAIHWHESPMGLRVSPHPAPPSPPHPSGLSQSTSFAYPASCVKFALMAILTRVRWCFTEILIYISLIISEMEHLFMCLLTTRMFSLEKCLFRSSTIFFFYCFSGIELQELFVLGRVIVSCFICKYFLPFWRLSFCLFLWFPLLCKSF